MRKKIGWLGRGTGRPRLGTGFNGPVEDILTWDVQARGDVAVVVLDGELDMYSAPGLAGWLLPAAGDGRHLILDLAALRFCDCAGLSLFLRTQQRARAAGGSLHLAALSASLRRLIRVARMSDVLSVTTSVADTIALLDPAGPAG